MNPCGNNLLHALIGCGCVEWSVHILCVQCTAGVCAGQLCFQVPTHKHQGGKWKRVPIQYINCGIYMGTVDVPSSGMG